MSLKYFVVIIAVGSGFLISMNALNAVYYSQLSWSLIFEIISGPVLTIALLPKSYWLRVNALIISCTGLAGLLQILANFGKLYFLGVELRHPVSLYFFHGGVSLLFLITATIWYVFDKRRSAN